MERNLGRVYPPALLQHLTRVAHAVGRAIEDVWQPAKVGLIVAGLEVPHVHLHLTPIWGLGDLSFASVDRNAKPADLDAAAEKLRAALRAAGHGEASD